MIFKFDGKVSWGTGVAGTRENREGRKGTRDGERKGEKQKFQGAFVWEYSRIRMYSGIYSGYSAPGSRIARMESRYSGMRIAPKQMLTCIIPIILIPD